MRQKDVWIAMMAAHQDQQLSPLHERLYFQNPRPIVELYDLEKDPLELQNLAGLDSHQGIERQLQIELEKWMIREHDYLPLPTHALQNQR